MASPSKLRSWYEGGRYVLAMRLTASGSAAGIASWLLLWGLHRLAATPKPSVAELTLAVALGALFGAVLAVVLSEYWDRHPGPER